MKKWLLSKLFLLLGLTSFAQFFQTGTLPLNDVSSFANEQLTPDINALPPVMGEVHPELVAELQQTLDSLGEMYNAIGLSAALLLPNGDVWKGVSGLDSSNPNDSLTTDMVFGMGSVTKTFAGAAIMQLVAEGQITLDDSLDMWLPSYSNVDGSITIRHLLNHTSGIYNYTDNNTFWGDTQLHLDSIFPPSLVLDTYVEAPVFEPGTNWGYSNSNYLLLGLIVESVTGNSFHQEVRTRLLEPNDHTSMSLFPYEMPIGEPANVWLDITGDGVPDDLGAANFDLTSIFSGAWSAGALMSDAEDLAHWIKHLMTGEVVAQSELDEMMDLVDINPSFGYGLSLMRLKIGGVDWWGHSGGIFYQTLALYSPEYDISMVLFTNDASLGELDDIYFELIQTYLDFQPTSIDEAYQESLDLVTYPNPFSDYLMLAFELENNWPVTLTVTNQKGQTMYQQVYEGLPLGLNNIHLAQCADWPAGIYQIQLETPGWFQSKRIVK